MSSLYWRFLILAVTIALFTVGMTFLLISFKVDHTLRELRHGRFDLIASDIDRVIEHSLSLGMHFSELIMIAAVLERRDQDDNAIVSIDVADVAGRIVYTTTAGLVGQTMPAAWFDAIHKRTASNSKPAEQVQWRILGSEEAVAGSVVRNSFGMVMGYVAVRYSTTQNKVVQARFQAGLRPVALAVFVVTAGALFFIMALLANRFERDIARACERVDSSHDIDQLDHGWEALIGPVVDHFAGAETALADWRQAHGEIAAKTRH